MQWRDQVSTREADVLAAIQGHQSNAQIAARLHLSIRTVEGHVSSLLRRSAGRTCGACNARRYASARRSRR